MKLIQTTDLRLCPAGHAGLPPEKEKQRAAELFRCLEDMIAYAEEEEIEGILFLGHLFDRGRIFPHMLERVLQLFREHEDLAFFYLPASREEIAAVRDAGNVPANLELFDTNWTQFQVGNVMISGVVMEEENAESLYEAAHFPEKLIHLVLMYQAGPDGSSLVDTGRMKHKNIACLSSGPSRDYHMESLDESGIQVSSGSPEGLDFEEEGMRGFVVLDVDEETRQISSRFVPFAKRQLFTIPLDITGASGNEEIIHQATQAMEERQVPNTALVRLVLTGELDIESEKEDGEIIRALAPSCFHLKYEDRSKFVIDASRYENDASLRGEFVRRVLAEEDLQEEEKITIIRMGLQAIRKEEVTA